MTLGVKGQGEIELRKLLAIGRQALFVGFGLGPGAITQSFDLVMMALHAFGLAPDHAVNVLRQVLL